MSKELEALEKIDHTVCLNINNKTLKFGLDNEEHIDCQSVEEFVECYDTIEIALKDYEKLKEEKLLLSACRDLPTLEKKLKVVEIIKREPSSVIEIITTYDSWEEYTNDYPISDKKIWHFVKNKDEFDLLKEELL